MIEGDQYEDVNSYRCAIRNDSRARLSYRNYYRARQTTVGSLWGNIRLRPRSRIRCGFAGNNLCPGRTEFSSAEPQFQNMDHWLLADSHRYWLNGNKCHRDTVRREKLAWTRISGWRTLLSHWIYRPRSRTPTIKDSSLMGRGGSYLWLSAVRFSE